LLTGQKTLSERRYKMTQKFGVPTNAQLAKINKLAKRTLSAEEVFVFPSKLAGDMIIPDRYVQLTKELLDVFAADADKGVSFLLDHSWHADGFFGIGGRPKAAIPYGRTFNSSFGSATEEGETISLNADTYMMRGVSIDGISTDDLIQSIEAGTLFDTSIGFSYNKAVCSICGNNINDSSKCDHYPGKTYEIEGRNGVKQNKLCFAKAYPPGGLWENSGVFDGAYPGAGMLSKAGDILENETGLYQVITELKDIDPAKSIIATYGQRSGLLTMVKKSENKKVFSIGSVLVDGREYTEGDIIKFAKEGILYHAKAVDEAIRWGVRAMGNDFAAETWKNTLAIMEIQDIDNIVETWKTQAKELIPSGRHTDIAAGHKMGSNSNIPDEAFKVR
jgi:hypothetical protein